jgi:hypothetical protein
VRGGESKREGKTERDYKEITEEATRGRAGVDHSFESSLKGFDFLTRAIFPAIHDKIFGKFPNVFSPAVADAFHQNYVISNRFLGDIEFFFLSSDDPLVRFP